MSDSLRATIITSPAAERMLNRVSPIYDDSVIGLYLFEAMGREFDSMNALIEDLPSQLNPDTATWMLPLWERRYGIEGAGYEIDERRRRVRQKQRRAGAFNPARIVDTVRHITGLAAQIRERIADYTFAVALISDTTINLRTLETTLNRMKPSHMAYEIMYQGAAGRARAWPMTAVLSMEVSGMRPLARVAGDTVSGNPVRITGAKAANALYYAVELGPLQEHAPSIDHPAPLRAVSRITIEQYKGSGSGGAQPAASLVIELGDACVYADFDNCSGSEAEEIYNMTRCELLEWYAVDGTTIRCSKSGCDITGDAQIEVLSNTVHLTMELPSGSVAVDLAPAAACSHLQYIENGGDVPHWEAEGHSTHPPLIRLWDELHLYLPIRVGTTYAQILEWFRGEIEAGRPLQITGSPIGSVFQAPRLPIPAGNSELYCADANTITVRYE